MSMSSPPAAQPTNESSIVRRWVVEHYYIVLTRVELIKQLIQADIGLLILKDAHQILEAKENALKEKWECDEQGLY